MVRPRSCRVIYYFDIPALEIRYQLFDRVSAYSKSSKYKFFLRIKKEKKRKEGKGKVLLGLTRVTHLIKACVWACKGRLVNLKI